MTAPRRDPARFDLAIGTAAAGVRLGWRAGRGLGRAALFPVRVAQRAPILGPRLESLSQSLTADGAAHRERWQSEVRVRGPRLLPDLLARPEAAQLVDDILAGPLVDAVAAAVLERQVVDRVAAGALPPAEVERLIAGVLGGAVPGQVARTVRDERLVERIAATLLAGGELRRMIDLTLAGGTPELVVEAATEQRTVQRIATPLIDDGLVERFVSAVLTDPRTARLASMVLDSDLVDELTGQFLRSNEFQQVLERVARSPEILAAVTQHTESLAGEVVADVRTRSERADDAFERGVRRVLRRPRPDVVAEVWTDAFDDAAEDDRA